MHASYSEKFQREICKTYHTTFEGCSCLLSNCMFEVVYILKMVGLLKVWYLLVSGARKYYSPVKQNKTKSIKQRKITFDGKDLLLILQARNTMISGAIIMLSAPRQTSQSKIIFDKVSPPPEK